MYRSTLAAFAIGIFVVASNPSQAGWVSDYCFDTDEDCTDEEEDMHEAFFDYMEEQLDDQSSEQAEEYCSSPSLMKGFLTDLGFEILKAGATWVIISASGDLSDEAFDNTNETVSNVIDLTRFIAELKSEGNC